MKVGLRTPNPKKSLKARTTGKLNRAAKKAVNPMHGKKGMGFVKNPERAVKNAIYHRTTVGVGDIIDGSQPDADVPIAPSGLFIFLIIVGIILAVMSLILTLVYPVLGIIGIIGGIACAVYGRKKLKEFKQ